MKKAKRTLDGCGTGAISRRRFITEASSTAAAGAAAISLAGCGQKPAQKSGKGLKYVMLGRTNMKTSVFLGDRMADTEMYKAALDAGINYWHKFGHWVDPAPYELFRERDRDSFYCDTVVASLEKDKAIEIFEGCLKKTGLEYIDGFKVHSQYRKPEDVKAKTGVIQAFETLKKQGKTRHLMMSQHVNTSEIFEAAIDSDFFDLIQVPVNPTVPRDYFTDDKFSQTSQDRYLALIKKAAGKGIAVTAMKVFLYGAKNWEEVPDLRERVSAYLPDNKSIATALIHWALNVPGVKAYGSMLYSFDELKENLEAVGGTLTASEDQGLRRFAECMGGYYCRMCGACERANPDGVAVSDILRFSGYYTGFGATREAREYYAQIPKTKRADAVNDYRSYEKACPYGVRVGELLRKAHERLG
ncbi:twin-arginine translocation signal domain-containing protein [bacterium]|nr:twin-arginine translocation signal domain-containing protein [bacterium]